jgi:hypothetical protein
MSAGERGSWRDRVRAVASAPRFWQWFHGVSAVHWLAVFGPGMLWWSQSVPFLMYVSLATALTGALVGYGTALAARKADPDDPT